MKVFISWSGDRSKAVAEILDEWLQCVLQAIDPWMSSKDIDRGSLWFSEISDQLADTKLGIICLTQENKNKPWILFEAGALAKGLKSSRVCTFLIDLQPTDVGNPLAQFNHTFPDKDGVFELLRTINSSLGDKALKEKVLEKVFETYWPQFESQFENALACSPQTEKIEPRSEENMLVEVLSSVRRLDRRLREIEAPRQQLRLDGLESNPPGRHDPRIPKSHAKRLVLEMVDADMPKEYIYDKMRNYGVPLGFVRRMMRESQESESNENDKEDEG